MKSKDRSKYMVTLRVIIISLLFCANSYGLPPHSKLKIGVIAPLTGPAASSGETVRNSISLATRKFDSNHTVNFLFEDDQLTPKNTVSAANKLIDQDKVNGIIVFGSPTSLAVNSIAEQKRVPMIGLSIVNRVVHDKTYVMKHWVSANRENEKIVEQVIKHGYKSVAIIATVNDAMLGLRDLFIESRVSQVVFSQELVRDNLDYSTMIAKIKQLNPDAVYLLLWAPQPGLFAKQLRQAKYTGDIFGVHNLEDPNEIRAAQGALNQAWFVTGNDRHAQEFYAEYQRHFNTRPTAGGTNAYDVAKMFIEGAEAKDLNEYFHRLKDFHGVYGTYDATSHNDFDIPTTVKKISADEIVPE